MAREFWAIKNMELPHSCRSACLDSIGYEIPYSLSAENLDWPECRPATCLFSQERVLTLALKALPSKVLRVVGWF